jgi:single-strand DNA-binding protein
VNKVILIGNLGADPELKFVPSGDAVMKLRLATTERFKDKAGNKQEKTDWHTVVMFGKRAEALNKLLNKGSRIAIEGRIQTRSWEDKDGSKRYATDIVANDVELLDSKRNGGERQESALAGEPAGGWGGDDVPFMAVDGRLL